MNTMQPGWIVVRIISKILAEAGIDVTGTAIFKDLIDFRKGMEGNGNIKTTGDIRSNGIVNVTNRMIVGSGNNDAIPVISLAVGDTDTGFNTNGDGYVDFISNGRTTAFMKEGRFVVTVTITTM